MQRGDLITVALQGDAGKPRPALVIQADHFTNLPTLVALPLTSTILDLPLVRVTVEPSAGTGLRQRSQVIPHPACLHLGLREDGVGRLGEATQPADHGDQNVVHAARAERPRKTGSFERRSRDDCSLQDDAPVYRRAHIAAREFRVTR